MQYRKRLSIFYEIVNKVKYGISLNFLTYNQLISNMLSLNLALLLPLSTNLINAKPQNQIMPVNSNLNNDQNGDHVSINGNSNQVDVLHYDNANWNPAINASASNGESDWMFPNYNGAAYDDNSYNGDHVEVDGSGDYVDMVHDDYGNSNE